MPGPTTIPFGSPHAAKKWSGALFIDVRKKSYFDRKFVSTSDNSPIQRLTDLESDAGDTINFDLSLLLRGQPIYGDNRADGNEESLKFANDEVMIDQMRKPVSAGGKMTRKRTPHNLRTVAKNRLSDYWSQFIDEMNFIYLSGSRGMNEAFIVPQTWAGHAGNPVQAPDNGHLMFGGDAASKGDLDSDDKMSVGLIERAGVQATMMREVNPDVTQIMPIMLNGEKHFVMLMSPFQEHDLRTDSGATGWLEIQKAAAGAEGRANPIFNGSLGKINNIVLHSHESVIRFNDYGSGGNQPAARSLLLGRQAGVVAYGSSSGLRFSWKEEMKDYGNEPTVIAGAIIGCKKTRFKNSDFGVISIDTYARNPNVAA